MYAPRTRRSTGFMRRCLRKLWRIASTCLCAGMALAPFVPPPPPPPPPHAEQREVGGQKAKKMARRL